jgi:hypothetical protein
VGKPARKTHNLIDEVNALADYINDVLNKKEKERYFEAMAILHSFIENVLKWLVLTQILWNKAAKQGVTSPAEFEKLRFIEDS